MGVDDAEGEECGKMGVVEKVNTHTEGCQSSSEKVACTLLEIRSRE